MHISGRPPLADSWYSLSYLYLSVVGMLSTIVCGLLVSAITGKNFLHSGDPLKQSFETPSRTNLVFLSFFSGGCKQKRLRSDLFVRKSDLICFRWSAKSEVKRFVSTSRRDLSKSVAL